jgi:hypothetical protein
MGIEHPAITNALRTGYPNGEPEYPHCPVCNAECDEIYMDENDEIFGCDQCVKIKNAWETEECF